MVFFFSLLLEGSESEVAAFFSRIMKEVVGWSLEVMLST